MRDEAGPSRHLYSFILHPSSLLTQCVPAFQIVYSSEFPPNQIISLQGEICVMELTELFLDQLEAEAERTRRMLEKVPEGKDDWKPHDKSMALGHLTMLVARLPSWIAMIINKDELDLRPADGSSNIDTRPLRNSRELIAAMDEGVSQSREALKNTNADLLMKPWRLLVSGNVVSEELRYRVIRDTFSHLAHHRAQLGIYLRMNDLPVPAVYGPSADDQSFA